MAGTRFSSRWHKNECTRPILIRSWLVLYYTPPQTGHSFTAVPAAVGNVHDHVKNGEITI